MSILDFTYSTMVELMTHRYGKGEYHGKGLFRHLYTTGSLQGLEKTPPFLENPSLAKRIQDDWAFELSPVRSEIWEEGTGKVLLEYPDGGMSESVFIPMGNHNTLCVSSQVGCKRGCTFCRTAEMGLVRNLSAGEIVEQVLHQLITKKREIRNIVFMGMGEPFDNFENVIQAVDILSDPHGLGIPKKFISLSTCGHVQGLEKLARLIEENPHSQYSSLRLAVSINASSDKKRSEIMPVNLTWPLSVLKGALLSLPQSREKDRLFYEYVLIGGVNDSKKDAQNLLDFLSGLGGKVNLIPLHVGTNEKGGRTPSEKELNQFWTWIREGGRQCRTRRSKGKDILAACGQLAVSQESHD